MRDVKAKIKPHLIRAFGILCTLGLALSVNPVTAKADMLGVPTRDISKLRGTITLYLNTDSDLNTNYEWSSGSVTNIKSSNTKVVRAKRLGTYTLLYLDPLKAGTSKVTYKYKGKKYTATIVVKNWANPVKTLTVGGKNYASKFTSKAVKKRGEFAYMIDVAKLNGTVKVKPASGWKLQSIKYGKFDRWGGWFEYRTIKNGSKVSKAQRGDRLVITLKNTKTGGCERILLSY